MQGRGHLASPPPTAIPGAPRYAELSDSVVVAITRELHGRFTPEQKDTVKSVLAAGVALGYEFIQIDVDYVPGS